jgi:hypothetical protein
MLTCIKHGRSDEFDVAFLELNPEVALPYLQKVPIGLDQIVNLGPEPKGSVAVLCGYPLFEVKKFQSPGNTTIVPHARQMVSYTLTPSDWPTPPEAEPRANRKADVFLDYPNREAYAEAGYDGEMPDPTGWSGGGIWALPEEGSGVWKPEGELFAIQSSWYKPEVTSAEFRSVSGSN